MKTIFILSDSMNRRFLNCYGAEEKAVTPNIDRLAKKSVVFDNHWCGSAPCMPARRELMTGRVNFLERPWGGIEPYDHTIAELLREKNVYTHMETDHFHYAERGGENFWGEFTSWNLHRGTEHDTINWGPDRTGIPSRRKKENYCGLYSPSYEVTKKLYNGRKEAYSTPRTFQAAAEWLERYHDADNFMLWVEGFDPHEPFDVPQEYIDLYNDDYKGPEEAYWPDYEPADAYTPEQIRHMRNRYKALVTMTDEYIGKLLDVLDKYNMWEDTMVIFTTDHGYMLGEHGFMGKCYMPDYNEIYHIPLMIALPGKTPGRCSALTQTVDLFPTILDFFGVDLKLCKNPIHGKNLLPLIRGEVERVRDIAIYGVFGKTVNITDGHYTYNRSRVNSTNTPLYIYGAMLSALNKYMGYESIDMKDLKKIEMGRYLSWTEFPVYKIPAEIFAWDNNALDIGRINRYVPGHQLFDIKDDYKQQHPLNDPDLEQMLIESLRKAMKDHDSPVEQFERLGL